MMTIDNSEEILEQKPPLLQQIDNRSITAKDFTSNNVESSDFPPFFRAFLKLLGTRMTDSKFLMLETFFVETRTPAMLDTTRNDESMAERV
jgi:hypothetical protein